MAFLRTQETHNLIRSHTLMFLALYGASYIATILIGIFLTPVPLSNILGFLSLLCYVATLLPTLLRTVFPAIKGNKTFIGLVKYRRHLGIAAFCLGANHGVAMIIQRHLNLLDWHTYIHYFQGITILAIFTLMAFTSNDESVKLLKKNWQKLHRLTYLVIFLLPWHILDKMFGHWTYLTPWAVLLMLVIVITFLKKLDQAGRNNLPFEKG